MTLQIASLMRDSACLWGASCAVQWAGRSFLWDCRRLLEFWPLLPQVDSSLVITRGEGVCQGNAKEIQHYIAQCAVCTVRCPVVKI